MTWDGIPEHRNLYGDGEQAPKTAAEYIAELARRQRQARQRGADTGIPQPDPAMPPDPFDGTLPGAVAQSEMFASLLDGGFTEPQALYYLACLVQVGLAMRMGRFGAFPPWPQE